MASDVEQAKQSKVEEIKRASNYLRDPVADELKDGNDHFGSDSIQIIKHFGTYQQDDRDLRQAYRKEGKGKAYIMMVRTKIPGGKMTSQQLLAELDLCDEIGNTTLRITTRQGLQLHGILKQNLKQAIKRINDVQLSTLGACGDVNRNVMSCPAPFCGDPVHAKMQALAEELAEKFAPRTSAYHELWLTDTETGEKQLAGGGAESGDGNGDGPVEPLYGEVYMPRKFKVGVALPGDNCTDIYSQDVGLMAIPKDFDIVGYNILVGGGFGVTPSADKTYPAVALRMAFCKPEQVVGVTTAILKVQRDFGNRVDRKVARLKYLVRDWGLEKFKAKVEEYFGEPLPEPAEEDVYAFDDHMGWSEQGDGNWFYGLNVENGRIKDDDKMTLKSALREICETIRPGIRLTPHQSILFTDIAPGDKANLEGILQRHSVPLTEQISAVRRWSMACVAWPTCGLSITESERALPGMVDEMEQVLAKLGLAQEEFTVRMTGCPNGCARPYNSDIGLVGKAREKYTVFLGGRKLGDRLNFVYKDLVPHDEVVKELIPIFAYFKQAREENETLGDFCHRKGQEDLLAFAESYQG